MCFQEVCYDFELVFLHHNLVTYFFFLQVCDAKMLWVDRLGFDVRFRSPLNDVFEARIPFPREVTDEKGAKSSFNCMSQFAWEVEKNFHAAEFEKVKQVKKMEHRGL